MTEHRTLRPVGGARVRDPITGRYLADEGEAVPMTAYWQRRIAAGEVEEVPQAKAKVARAAGKADSRPTGNRE